MIGLLGLVALTVETLIRAVGMLGKRVDEASGFMTAVSRRFHSSSGGEALGSLLLRALSRGLHRILPLIALIVVGIGMAPRADAQEAGPWRAIEVTGVVYVRESDGTVDDWRPLAAQETLYEDSDVRTWNDATATLTNGLDTIRMQPNAQVTLRAPEQHGMWMNLRQKLGIIFYEAGKRTGRTFAVDAPNLVVLVKGTEFF